MEVLEYIFKILHFLGFSVLFGSIVGQALEKKKRIYPATRYAGMLAVASGVGLYIIVGVSEGWDHINTIPFFIKLALLSISAYLAYSSKSDVLTKNQFWTHSILLGLVIAIAVLFL